MDLTPDVDFVSQVGERVEPPIMTSIQELKESGHIQLE